MYKLMWWKVNERFTGNVFGQAIPMTNYKTFQEKTKNKDIETKIEELLSDEENLAISFWKFPTGKNRLTSVTTVSGKMENENWKELL